MEQDRQLAADAMPVAALKVLRGQPTHVVAPTPALAPSCTLE